MSETKQAEDQKLKEYKLKDEQLSESAAAEKRRSQRQKIRRIAVRSLAGILVVLVLAFVFRDILIENSVRHIGTMLTGTEVEIADFNSSLSGKIELRDIKIANPEGFRNPHAVKIEHILVKLSVPTLLTDEPVVEKIEVNGVYLDFEIKNGKSNLDVIQDNISGPNDNDAEEKKDEPQPKSSSGGPEPLFKRIALTSMSVTFSSSALKSSLPVPLPPVYLYNIGGKGYPLSATLLKITDAVITGINKVGGNVLSGLDSVGEAGKSAVDKVKKLFK